MRLVGCVGLLLGGALACGARPAARPATEGPARVSPSASVVPRGESAPAASPAPADVRSCPLAANVVRLGDPASDATIVTAPVETEAGVLVGLLDGALAQPTVATQLVGWDGDAQDAVVLEKVTPPRTVALVAQPGGARLAITDGSMLALRDVDARGRASRASRPPSSPAPHHSIATGSPSVTALAASPEGLVAAHLAGRDLVVSSLAGTRTSTRARTFDGVALPDEIALASGPEADVVVTSRRVAARDDALELVAVPRRGPARAAVALARGAHGGFEAHVARGGPGFLVVWSAPPHFGELRAVRLDPSGLPASPERVLAKAERPGEVLRFPRVTALGEGWAVGVWTGLGVAALRVSAAGEASAPPFDVPTGDSAGGLTEVWPAATSHGLALTWMPRRPFFANTVETETPPRGARLALLACEAASR